MEKQDVYIQQVDEVNKQMFQFASFPSSWSVDTDPFFWALQYGLGGVA